MAEISRIVADDFDAIFEKFLKEDDHRVGQSDWRKLFTPVSSQLEDPEFGYKLTHNGQVVGMLGMVQSRRITEKGPVTFCNLHSWFVDEQHRGNSLLLLRPILKQKEWVITDFTPTPAVVEISLRLGFRLWSPQQFVLKGPCNQVPHAACQLAWNADIDMERLHDFEKAIYRDHDDAVFQRLLITLADDHTLVILRRIEMGRPAYGAILYSSNPQVMLTTQPEWQSTIQDKLQVKKLVGSKHQLGGEPIGGINLIREPQQLIRAKQFEVPRLDTLYSEVSLLGLSTLPSRKALLFESMRKLNPLSWFKK